MGSLLTSRAGVDWVACSIADVFGAAFLRFYELFAFLDSFPYRLLARPNLGTWGGKAYAAYSAFLCCYVIIL